MGNAEAVVVKRVAMIGAICLIVGNFAGADTSKIDFDAVSQTLSVHLIDAEMADVAGRLSGQAGIRIVLDKNVSDSVSSIFDELTLEEGIRRLFRNANTAMVFKRSGGRSRLETVRIFGNGESGGYETFDPAIRESGRKSTVSTGPMAVSGKNPENEIIKARHRLARFGNTKPVGKLPPGVITKLGRAMSPEKRALVFMSMQTSGEERHRESVARMRHENRYREQVRQYSAKRLSP